MQTQIFKSAMVRMRKHFLCFLTSISLCYFAVSCTKDQEENSIEKARESEFSKKPINQTNPSFGSFFDRSTSAASSKSKCYKDTPDYSELALGKFKIVRDYSSCDHLKGKETLEVSKNGDFLDFVSSTSDFENTEKETTISGTFSLRMAYSGALSTEQDAEKIMETIQNSRNYTLTGDYKMRDGKEGNATVKTKQEFKKEGATQQLRFMQESKYDNGAYFKIEPYNNEWIILNDNGTLRGNVNITIGSNSYKGRFNDNNMLNF